MCQLTNACYLKKAQFFKFAYKCTCAYMTRLSNTSMIWYENTYKSRINKAWLQTSTPHIYVKYCNC